MKARSTFFIYREESSVDIDAHSLQTINNTPKGNVKIERAISFASNEPILEVFSYFY